MGTSRFAAVFLFSFIFFISLETYESKNILIFQILSSPSHEFAVLPLANALADKGHKITYISPINSKGKPKFNKIIPEKLATAHDELFSQYDIFNIRVDGKVGIFPFFFLFRASVKFCQAFLDSPNVADIIENKVKYDLILADSLCAECLLGISQKQKIPVLYYATSYIYPWQTSALGLPIVTPNLPTISILNGFSNSTKLSHRMLSVASEVIRKLYRRYITFPALEEMWKKRVGKEFSSFESEEENISLMFTNTHSSAKLGQFYTHNVIPIGGIHIQPPKLLPKDIQSIADGSGEDGFIVFALGSVTNANTMPKKFVDLFIQTFKRLKQRVFWKFDLSEEKMKNLPKNVYVYSWLPQTDLLAHPKCKGFVSHGGMLSFLETVHYSIPVVILPFFADQDYNAYFATENELGIGLEIQDITENSLFDAIYGVVTNPKYKKNMKRRSDLLNDQPMKPLDVAVYWTEWLLRHKDASHLKPLAAKWSWFSYYLVDVWLIFAAIFGLVVFIISKTSCFLLRCLMCCKSQQTQKKVKKH